MLQDLRDLLAHGLRLVDRLLEVGLDGLLGGYQVIHDHYKFSDVLILDAYIRGGLIGKVELVALLRVVYIIFFV